MKDFQFKINGNSYKVNIRSVEDGLAEIEVNGTSYQVTLETKVPVSKTPKLVRAKTPQYTGVHQPMTTTKISTILAPLPGTILEIQVKEGDAVLPEQVMLKMEAMKMENPRTAQPRRYGQVHQGQSRRHRVTGRRADRIRLI